MTKGKVISVQGIWTEDVVDAGRITVNQPGLLECSDADQKENPA